MIKVLFFDIKESEKDFFIKNNISDIDFTLFEEPITKKTKLTQEQLKETEALCIYNSSIITSDIMKQFKNLRMIIIRSMAINNVDIDYCIKNRIMVFNVSSYGENAIAEYSLCLILALERKIKPAILDVHNGKINHKDYEGNILSNLTIGIIGCGRVGIRLAEIADFLGMKVLVSSYKASPNFETFCNVVPFDKLLEESDIIALHMPYTTETYQIIGHEEFQKMKKGVMIINTSCVALINIEALYQNLLSGKVKGAGLDILDSDFAMNRLNIGNETMSSKENYKITAKLLELPNVVITPHIAYNTVETVDYVLETTINNIRSAQKGMNHNRIC